MDKSNPDTIQIDDDPSLWAATQVDDVFLPAVRVTLGWADVEKAVERGAVVPAQAHALWAAWPVKRAARLGEQVGAAQNAWRKSTPSSASRCKFGVGI